MNDVQPNPERPLALAAPRVDFFEGEQGFLLRADLPGVRQEELSLQLNGRELTLEATQGELTQELFTRTRFRRKLTLPQEVDPEQIQARLEAGVLTVALPRGLAHRVRQIPIVQA
jgi:HSP20 family protein